MPDILQVLSDLTVLTAKNVLKARSRLREVPPLMHVTPRLDYTVSAPITQVRRKMRPECARHLSKVFQRKVDVRVLVANVEGFHKPTR